MDSKLVFVVGMARTGTTLMARSLNKGDGVYILNETHLIREYQHLLSSNTQLTDYESDFIQRTINQFITIQNKGIYRKSEYQEYPDAVTQVLKMFETKSEKTFLELIKCLFQYESDLHGKKCCGDQTPNHVFHIDQLINLFPKAVFINMVRDPRAVVLSQKNKWKAAKRSRQPLFEIIRTRINYHPITQSILWIKSVDSALVATNKFGDAKVKNVYYENFVNEPENQLKSVCSFIGVEYSHCMLDISVSMSSNVSSSSVMGIDPSLTDKWRTKLSSTEIFFVEFFCKKRIKQFGYKMTGIKPNLLMLAAYLLFFPLHICFAYFFSAGRIKNPFQFFKKIFK